MRTSMAERPADGRKGLVGSADGFTLVEMLIAILILAFGLLTAGQMIYASMASMSLARSKGGAAVVAQNKLQFLSDLYSRNQAAADLTLGNHGPEIVQITNPADNNNVLNRLQVAWTVSDVVDPRAGKSLKALQVIVTVTPVNNADVANRKAFLNKIVTVGAVFSPRNS
jgi:prepilin-type N-terminal cleavage/methylation domain-containing protein